MFLQPASPFPSPAAAPMRPTVRPVPTDPSRLDPAPRTAAHVRPQPDPRHDARSPDASPERAEPDHARRQPDAAPGPAAQQVERLRVAVRDAISDTVDAREAKLAIMGPPPYPPGAALFMITISVAELRAARILA